MPRYQNQSSGTVIAGRGIRFAPGEIKEGNYQKYADAGVLVLVGDQSEPVPPTPVKVAKPAPARARVPAPARAPAPTPAREERVTPEALEDLAAHGQTLKDLDKPEPVPEEKMLRVDPPENVSISKLVDDESEPEPERKSSPRGSRRKKKKTKRS